MAKKPSMCFRPEQVTIEGDQASIELGLGANSTLICDAGILKPVSNKATPGTVHGYRVRCPEVIKKVEAIRAQL